MKVILSRKGFDSENGGYPSPILPDGKMVSLPIPSDELRKYSDLSCNKEQTYYDIMTGLNPRIRNDGEWIELTRRTECHLDPDIYRSIIKRAEGWRPVFGQIKASQTHLESEGIGEDDIFLFFGTFKWTDCRDGRLVFIPESPEVHVIFGYFQVGEVMKINESTRCPAWMRGHPHTDIERRRVWNNTVYIARKTLSWDQNLSGADTFNYHKKLVLTKEGYLKSQWALPASFRKVKITYHSIDSWKKEGYFQSVAKGQEFVVHCNKEVERWSKRLISTTVKGCRIK